MRISTQQFTQNNIESILNQQSQLNHTQQELSTGRKIVNPSDNPSGAAQVLGLQSAIATNKQYQSNGNAATANLNLEQSTLGQVGQVLQSVRTLVLQANNGTQTNTSRADIASQIDQNFKQILSAANTQDSNGNFIFSGSQTATKPFVQNLNHSVSYQGDTAQQFIQIDNSRQVAVNDPGNNVFMNILNGNGTFTANASTSNTGNGVIKPGTVLNQNSYTGDTYKINFINSSTYNVVDTTTGTTVATKQTYLSGASIKFGGIQTSITGQPAANDSFTIAKSQSQSVFTTLNNIVTTLKTPASNSQGMARLHNSLNQELSSLGQAMNNIIDKQANVGARQNTISNQQQLQKNWGVQLQKAQSKIQNVNIASAISQYQLELTALQASQKTYTQVQGLSLFKYI